MIIDRLSRILSYGRYARGDAVVLKYDCYCSFRTETKPFSRIIRSPFDPNVWLLKRILALEGDIVVTSPPHPYAEICIPRGHMWVEGSIGVTLSARNNPLIDRALSSGDEPFHSHDSNQFGPVSKLAYSTRATSHFVDLY